MKYRDAILSIVIPINGVWCIPVFFAEETARLTKRVSRCAQSASIVFYQVVFDADNGLFLRAEITDSLGICDPVNHTYNHRSKKGAVQIHGEINY